MSVLTVIIIALEVASLNTDRSNQLSSTASTGAGIWCSISFVTTIVFMYLLGLLRSFLLVLNCSLSMFSFVLQELSSMGDVHTRGSHDRFVFYSDSHRF